jgi:penicillin-binding protein 1A
MVAAGYLKQSEADATFATDLFKAMATHHAAAATGRDPRTAHFVDYVLSYLDQRYSETQIYEGGMTVQTSLDLPTQLYADQAVKQGVATYKVKGANTGALLAMDPKDGEVLAMVGSADYNREDIRGQVNLTGADPSGYRPVGSSFKAYTYAAALETGQLTAASKVDDQNTVINGHRYSDWDGRTEGMIPLRQAFQESRNLPALQTYKAVGGARVVAMARKLGITTPIESPDSLPTTLGTNSMSMMEHLAAYSAFDNGGFKISPHAVLKVTDAHGTVLESFDRKASTQRVITPELAYLETDIMRGPPRTYLGYGASAPVAAKSGTTESWTGAYWIGYTPDIAVATYMAHINAGDQCTSGFGQLAQGFQASGWLCPTNVLWGEHVGLSVWKPFLDGYYSHRAWPAAWAQPAGVVKETVCKADGSKVAPTTPADQTSQELFIANVGEPVDGLCMAAARAAPSPSPSPSPGHTASPSPSPGH